MFRICCMINKFYVYAFYHNPGSDGSFDDCPLDSMARLQSVDDKAVFVFVSDAELITLSGWSRSLSQIRPRWCKWSRSGLWSMQVMLKTWVRIPCETGVPVSKVSYRSINHRALFHTLCGLSHSRMYLKTL